MPSVTVVEAKDECAPPTPRSTAPCTCGCEGAVRCGIECLEKPLFHAGQLLTAESLQLGAKYVEQRLALRRYIDGVGIVCGLHVRCHPTKRGQIIIDPGYAIDCCGNDIVLCEPHCVDICKCVAECDWEQIPCDESSAPEQKGITSYTLRLEHVLEERDPVPVVVGHSKCGRESRCRPSRLKTNARICVEVSVDAQPIDPTGEFRALALELWDRVTTPAPSGKATKGKPGNLTADSFRFARDMADRLRLWLADHPPSVYCDLRPYLTAAMEVLLRECDTPSDIERDAAETVLRVLGAVMDDRRQAYLQRACDDCCVKAGVAVAELFISSGGADCEPITCSIVAIDAQPPARESLHPRDPWWRRDMVSLYDVYYRDAREACVVLGDRGLIVDCAEIPARPRDYPRKYADRLLLRGERNAFRYEWLAAVSGACEMGRLAVYRDSDLYAECGATVMLWTVKGRVVSIEVSKSGNCGGGEPGSFKQFLECTLNPTDAAAFIAKTQNLPPCDDEQQALDPLDRLVQGIGPKLEATFFRSGIVSLKQLRATPYSQIHALASQTRRGFEKTQWERWLSQADRLLANPATLKRLRLRYQAETKRRYEDALTDAPVDSLSTMLTGVGSKMEAVLFREGILTLDQFRRAPSETIRRLATETKRGSEKNYEKWIVEADELLADVDHLADIRKITRASALRRYNAVKERS